MKNKQMNRTGNIQRKTEKCRSKSQDQTAPKNGKKRKGKKAKTGNSSEYFSHLVKRHKNYSS